MRPSTPPHYTSPADLRERLNRRFEQPKQSRIQAGIEPWNGGAFRGLMFATLFMGIAAVVLLAITFGIRYAFR